MKNWLQLFRASTMILALFVSAAVSPFPSTSYSMAANSPDKNGESAEGSVAEQPGDKKCRHDEKVVWQEYAQAIASAEKSGKPLMIVFSKENCRKCEMLKEKGFDRPDIACYVNQQLSPVRINGKDNPGLVEKYRVSHYPMVWFLDPQAGEIDYFVGYVKPQRLLLILHYIGDGVYKNKPFSEYEKEQENK